jgi:hypothetical protein
LADMVRTDRHQLRPIAGNSGEAEAVKVVTRAHKTLIWERVRHLLRLRHALRDFFPAALAAFDDLTAPDALQLLGAAPDPTSAARLTKGRITAALNHARRRNIAGKATAIQTALRAEQLSQPAVVTAAYAATVRAQVAILITLNTEINTMEEQVEAQAPRSRARKGRASGTGCVSIPTITICTRTPSGSWPRAVDLRPGLRRRQVFGRRGDPRQRPADQQS